MGLVNNPVPRRKKGHGGKVDNVVTRSAQAKRIQKGPDGIVYGENFSGRGVGRGPLVDQRSKPVATRALKRTGLVSGNLRKSR
jgi:hypothetical protein